jgi:hypothetical protein
MNIRIFTEENQGNEVGKELVYPANLLATRSGAHALNLPLLGKSKLTGT